MTRHSNAAQPVEDPFVNVAQFLRSLFRRPLALALLATLGVVAGLAGWFSTPPTYQSTAVAVVIPPGSGHPDAMLNPLINMNNNISQLAAVVATAVQAEGGEDAAENAGGTGQFTVNTIYGDAAVHAQLTSQLVIVAEGSDPESARRAAAALVEFAREQLNKVQADSLVPVMNNALLIPSVEPISGVQVPTSAVRAAGSYALAAVLGGVLLMLVVDAVRGASRGRRRTAAPSESELGDDAADSPAFRRQQDDASYRTADR